MYRSKPILIMGGYRQWKLPKVFNESKPRAIAKQCDRYTQILEKWDLALKEKRETIVIMDDNIVINVNSYHNSANSVGVLYDRLMNHLYENNLTQHNFKLTHFSRIFKPSCIDHIYSNCPLKIDNVTTHTNSTSDTQL